ncbi:MAG: aspartyl-phosphate phosphatase Spo0E family protein [Desulfitobacterium hafniense]|nr:aspartyl-phosphate phosphatase Spo0E family protein [Desulfitobacterium hafniense]
MNLELEELLVVIEEMRAEINKLQDSANLQDPYLIQMSLKLDDLLNRYDLLMKRNTG